jgi:DNA-3-methyladenine glycosylase
MYWLLNVLVKDGTENGFVLFRALEPTGGIELMTRRRTARRPSLLAHPHALCSGPGKLTVALGIDGRDHGRDLCGAAGVGFRLPVVAVEVATDVRIGISRAAHLPWRFLAHESRFVSRRPRTKARPAG